MAPSTDVRGDAPRAARAGTEGRIVTPDLARGVMLLLIALAHAPAYLYGRDIGPGGYPPADTLLEKLAIGAETAAVTGRAYPLFAFLLGYGLVMAAARQPDARTARRRLRRRGAVLLLFGLAHATLLWGGDILGAYGVLTVLLAGVVVGRDARRLPLWVLPSLLVVALGSAAFATAADSPAGTRTSSALEAVGLRLGEWAPTLVVQPLGLFGAVLLGVWAARRRVLEHPAPHRRLLRRAATAGPLLAVAGGVPLALVTSGTWAHPPAWAEAAAGALHGVSGFGGIGVAAVIALVVLRRPRSGRLRTALAACGQRSLSCYLAQSVAFVALLAPYAAGLGRDASVPFALAVAVLVWALTVVAADAMRRRRRRGPAESLLRRAVHPPSNRPVARSADTPSSAGGRAARERGR